MRSGFVFLCRHSDYVKHLEAEVEWYRDRLDHERQRAEIAVDALLALKVGAPPVRSPEPQARETLEQVAERLMGDREFNEAGGA